MEIVTRRNCRQICTTGRVLHKYAGVPFRLTSVLGNDNAMGLNGAVIATADLVVVGFSTQHSVRAAMVHWFKAHYPKIPVVALQFYGWEKFAEADVATLSEDPTIWLAEIASILKS